VIKTTTVTLHGAGHVLRRADLVFGFPQRTNGGNSGGKNIMVFIWEYHGKIIVEWDFEWSSSSCSWFTYGSKNGTMAGLEWVIY